MTTNTNNQLGLISITNNTEAGLWGNWTNTNLVTLITEALGNYATVTIAGGTNTLTIAGGTASTGNAVARSMAIELQGVGGSTVTVPHGTMKLYFVYNNTSSPASAVTFQTDTGSGVSVPVGSRMILLCNGTNIVDAITNINFAGTPTFANLNVSGTAALANVSASGTVSGAGFSNYLASPPAIGGGTPAAATFTTLTTTSDSFGPGMLIGRVINIQEARSNTITLADDGYLVTPSMPIGRYVVRVWVSIQGSITTTQGLQVGLRAPSASGSTLYSGTVNGAAAGAFQNTIASPIQFANISTSIGDQVTFEFNIVTGAIGTIAMQWAQRSSSANATLLNSGYMTVTRVG